MPKIFMTIDFVRIRIAQQQDEINQLKERLKTNKLSQERYDLLYESALDQLKYFLEKHFELRPLLDKI